MKSILKRCAACLLALALLVAVIQPISVSAASYPLIIVDTDESSRTIMKGETGKIRFMISPYYHNEKYHVVLYNSSGRAVASVEDTYYNADGSGIKYITISIDTEKLDLDVGTYTAKYWLSYYSFQAWHDAPNVYSYTLQVTPYVCSGPHVYDSSCDPQCNACGETRSVVHTYSGSCDTSCNVCNTARTSNTDHTYSNATDPSCNVCGYTRIVIEPDYSSVIGSGTCGANLTWKLTQNGTLTISGTGTMYSYTSSNVPWKSYKTGYVRNVYIAPGVTSIGNYAFYWTDAEKISIPSTVTKIGENCFSGCDVLRQIILPDGIITIPNYAFSGCSSLESIAIPASVKSFGQGCFDDCSTLRTFVIPEGVKEIAHGMFWGCSGLEAVQIPSSVTSIDTFAFHECGSLSDVYYGGSSSQYNEIEIDSLSKYNEGLLNATIHYNAKMPCAVCSYGSWSGINSSSHQRACVRCGKTETGSHSWSSACDTSCNICGYTRTASNHVYSYVCDDSCNACGAKRQVTHTFTSDCDLGCDICGAVRNSGSKHTFDGGVVCTVCDTTFGDVSFTSWQISHVVYVCDRGLMSGKGADVNGNIKFDPNSPITREEFVQVLYNAEGKPGVSIANRFPDVSETGWYRNAVLWANSKNIANGGGDGRFGVGAKIIRQDLALMLYKYAIVKGCSLESDEGVTDQYGDSGKIAGYAKTAMDWAVTNGILSGKGTAGQPLSTFKLDPTGTATRAECAAMLRNFMTAFGL